LMQEMAVSDSPMESDGQPRLEMRNLGIPLVSVMETRAAKRRSRRRALILAAVLISVGLFGLAFVQ
jgi:hypothetical protein